MNQPYFGIEQCVNGGIYYLHAFNFNFGVYVAEVQGFVGIRSKLGVSYLFIEYHYDYSPIIGTAQPITLLGTCPETVLQSYIDSRDDQHQGLVRVLSEFGIKYGHGN